MFKNTCDCAGYLLAGFLKLALGLFAHCGTSIVRCLTTDWTSSIYAVRSGLVIRVFCRFCFVVPLNLWSLGHVLCAHTLVCDDLTGEIPGSQASKQAKSDRNASYLCGAIAVPITLLAEIGFLVWW